MGYRPARRVFDLQFDDEFKGLEIKVSSISFGELLNLGDQADRLRAGQGLGAVRGLVEVFTSKIQYWNLEDEITGEPVPIQLDAVLAQDINLIGAAILSWFDAMTSVSESLGKASISGRQSAPPNFPMDDI